jgi:hypothetical protein
VSRRLNGTAHPELNLHVPSVLEAVTYWYSLRAQGDALDDDNAFDKTFIGHFDLESTEVGPNSWLVVPGSGVNRGGVYLGRSLTEAERVSRLAAG